MTIENKQDVLNILRDHKADIEALGIKSVALFGSFANGEPSVDSDVDLLVEFEKGKKTFRAFMKFADFAERILERQVDVLTPESLSPHIGPHIQNDLHYV